MRFGKVFFCTDRLVHYGSTEVGKYGWNTRRGECVAKAVIGAVKLIVFGKNEHECEGLLRRSYENLMRDADAQ